MKSSISSLARFCVSRRRSVTASPSNTGARLDRLEIQRAVLVAPPPQRLRDAILQAQLVGEPRDRRDLGGGAAAVPSSQAATPL